MPGTVDRRRYPRVSTPVYYRPAGPELLHHRRATVDVSPGGMRVYSDERLAVGTRLEIELLLDGNTSARCWTRVAWVDELPEEAGAPYDIGLEFTDLADADRALLARVLSGA